MPTLNRLLAASPLLDAEHDLIIQVSRHPRKLAILLVAVTTSVLWAALLGAAALALYAKTLPAAL